MDFKTKVDIKNNVLKQIEWSKQCRHNRFIVDDTLNEVVCGICGDRLNPMWVLSELCGNEHRAAQRLKTLEDMAEKTKNKIRCKCEHCGKMTKIHRK